MRPLGTMSLSWPTHALFSETSVSGRSGWERDVERNLLLGKDRRLTSVNASFSIELILFSLRSKRRTPRMFLNACDFIESNPPRVIFKSSSSTPNSKKCSAASCDVVSRPSESDRRFRILFGTNGKGFE